MTAHPAAPRSGQRRRAPRRSVPDARETPDRPPAHSDLPTECTAPPTKEPTMSTVSYTHLTLPTIAAECRSRWSPYH